MENSRRKLQFNLEYFFILISWNIANGKEIFIIILVCLINIDSGRVLFNNASFSITVIVGWLSRAPVVARVCESFPRN